MLFTCPHCAYSREIADKFAGKSGKCPQCQKTVTLQLLGKAPPEPGNGKGSPSTARQKEEHIEITNIETIPGKTITTHYGLVCGSTVRSKNAFKDIGASFKNMFGGELKNYTRLLDETRQEAITRMIAQASSLGANAIVNVRFATSDVAAGAAEIYIYGTAVRVE